MPAAAKKKPTEAPFEAVPPSKFAPLGEWKDITVKVSELHESPLNRRKVFDDEYLKGLAASLLSVGLLEPLLVRPRAKGGFELVGGACRTRAAKIAGLKELPARVREMTDAQLEEHVLIENGQRKDLTALEEGETFRDLRDVHKYSIERIVERTGKSRTVVFQRMKLASLRGQAREFLEKGEMSASVAEFIARMPTKEIQEKALTLLTNGLEYGEQLKDLPSRRAKEILDAEFNLVLSKAPFDIKDASLLTGCGACGTCPKRTGAEPDLFAETGKDDRCLDSTCYQAKVSAGLAKLKANGARVVTAKHEHDVFSGNFREKNGIVDAAQRPDGKQTWRELLGDELPEVVISAPSGEQHKAVDLKAAQKLLEEKKPKVAKKLEEEAAKREANGEKWKAEQQREAEKRETAALIDKVAAETLIDSKVTLESAAQLVALALSKSYHFDISLKDHDVDVRKVAILKGPALVQVLCIIATHANRNALGGQSYPDVAAAITKAAKVDTKKLAAKLKKAPPGTCVVCGCVEAKACDGGCSWANKAQTLCTACTGGEE